MDFHVYPERTQVISLCFISANMHIPMVHFKERGLKKIMNSPVASGRDIRRSQIQLSYAAGRGEFDQKRLNWRDKSGLKTHENE